MRAEIIGKMKVRCYETVDANSNFKDFTLYDYLMTCTRDKVVTDVCTKLKNMDKSDPSYSFIKKRNRAATISCISPSRKDADTSLRNPLICIDIDAKENPKMTDPDELAKRLVKSPCVYCSGVSCSGKGVYVIVLLSSNTDNDDFRASFEALEADFRASGVIIDAQCKNVSRLRFASAYEPYLKPWKDNVQPYEFRRFKEKTVQHISVLGRQTYLGIEKIKILKEIVRMLIVAGYRADTYAEWLQIGFLTYPLGEDGFQIFDAISSVSAGYKGSDSVRKKFEQVSDSQRTERDCYVYFFGKAKKMIGPGYMYTAAANILKNKN